MGRVEVPYLAINGYVRSQIKTGKDWPVYKRPTRVYSRQSGNFKSIGWEIQSSKYDSDIYHIIVLDSELKKW